MEKQKRQEAAKMTSYRCSKCRDTTWIIIDDKARRCQCYKLDKTKKLWEASGVRIEQQEKSFKSYIPYSEDTKRARDCGIEYFRNYNERKNTRHNSIAFLGQVGSGKTHLSIALAVNFLTREIPVVYMPFRDTMMNIKMNILDHEYYKKSLEKYQKAEILLIDDLYKGKVTASDLNIMFEIINYRYINQMPIIISSEKRIDDILKVDEAIGSRIYEMCKGMIVEIKGKENNYRIRGCRD